MKRLIHAIGKMLFIAGMTLASAVSADFELTGPDGRRILLKDNGTWQYVQTNDKDRTADKSKQDGEAILVLERTDQRGSGCQITVRLDNKLPYEIRSLIPYYSVYRTNGVIYDTVSGAKGFNSIKPGDKQSREIEFAGISCNEISRVQVVGGGRCQMGDLDKFSATQEQCLARVRVAGSELLRFDK
jgi:hypothetical protein